MEVQGRPELLVLPLDVRHLIAQVLRLLRLLAVLVLDLMQVLGQLLLLLRDLVVLLPGDLRCLDNRENRTGNKWVGNTFANVFCKARKLCAASSVVSDRRGLPG